MKRFTVKKKRAGGSYAPTGAEIYAMNWPEAKKQFTKLMNCDNYGLWYQDEDTINDMLEEDIDANIDWYDGKGLYVLDYCNGWYYYGASRYIDTFNEDVYTWTIKRV